jgi:hypothetical protein
VNFHLTQFPLCLDKQNEPVALGWFLIGEGKLEEHLDEFPPNIEANSASDSVREARHRLKVPVQYEQKYSVTMRRFFVLFCRNKANTLSF